MHIAESCSEKTLKDAEKQKRRKCQVTVFKIQSEKKRRPLEMRAHFFLKAGSLI